MKHVLIALVRLYQKLISPLFPSVCRFYPTCSEYTIQALERYGVLQGTWKAIKRLAKCHPLHPGGFDPLK